MNKSKFLSIALLLFSFVILTNGLVFAEQEYTHQTSAGFWNPNSYSALVNNLLDNVNSSIQNFQDKLADIFFAQDRSKQIAADMKEREQEAMEAQEAKQQDQESQMEDFKERQEAQKQQRQDLMQDMSDRR